MYREHLLSIDHVQRLLYHQVDSGQDGRRSLRAPAFFISQSDKGFKGEFFTRGSEAERRISFFAQSLTTSVPELLETIQADMFKRAQDTYYSRLREVTRWEDVVPTLDDKCVVVMPWCEEEACEDDIKERSAKA